MIYTGDCETSAAAMRALRRAAARAERRATSCIEQQDLLVALLQEHRGEHEEFLKSTPSLLALSVRLNESDSQMKHLQTLGEASALRASTPLQTSIELSVQNGRITVAGLFEGLLANPRTHLLKLVATERAKTR